MFEASDTCGGFLKAGQQRRKPSLRSQTRLGMLNTMQATLVRRGKDAEDHFTRCKQHWFQFFNTTWSWDKIQPTEHLKLNQKVKQTALRCFLYM